jgi:hypothetical protein
VRYYGLAAASHSKARDQARALMQSHIAAKPNYATAAPSCSGVKVDTPPLCPHCHVGRLIVLEILLPQRKFPP